MSLDIQLIILFIRRRHRYMLPLGWNKRRTRVKRNRFLHSYAHQLSHRNKTSRSRNYVLLWHMWWTKQKSVCCLCYALCHAPPWKWKENNHKFFERGHSEIEADSIHSSVERAKKSTKVYHPSQWDTVVSMAKKINPYKLETKNWPFNTV